MYPAVVLPVTLTIWRDVPSLNTLSVAKLNLEKLLALVVYPVVAYTVLHTCLCKYE